MTENDETEKSRVERWWDCPTCGGDTEVEGRTRSCLECDWSVTIPNKNELKERGYDV